MDTNTVTGLLGPSGSGKTSLVQAILKHNNSISYWEKGRILINEQLNTGLVIKQNVGHVQQKGRLYTDTILANFLDGIKFKKGIDSNQQRAFVKRTFQRYGLWETFQNILDDLAVSHSMGIHKLLLIVKAMIRRPKLLILDEVLASTSLKDEVHIIELIKNIKKSCAILVITHNKDEAKDLCDSIALISGGILHEHTPSVQFFTQPITEIGREFLESGSAWYHNPEGNITPQEDDLTALRRFSSMSEFYWVLSNKLGGMQKPGLMTESEDDLRIMRQLGVDVLVTLQQEPIDIGLLEKYSIAGMHFPIVDMSVPELEKTYSFISKIQPVFDEKKSLVYHCKAGMGRTGTLLACHLLYLEGISAIQAIEKIRQVNYKYIQTSEQMDFVGQFESYIRNLRES
ncbi:MAG: ATP-binding cassette domain-containing protein [Proteobacteria bacterium]|nr:ATP-binding cassette domain-containing protein [Pseudomonadota bacterium]